MTMLAGTYFLGDLCYVMHPEWDEFCKLTIDEQTCLDGEFNLSDGRRFATYSTKYGDGSYSTSTNHTLGVDAGLIGCIRIEDIREDLSEERIRELGMIHTFDTPFETSGDRGNPNWDGVIKFGDVEVYTGDMAEDEYFDDEEEDWV
jgi:hypothetical protein